MLTNKIRKRVFEQICFFINHAGFEVISIGGTQNHVHILIQVNNNIDLSGVIRFVKCKSSKFANTINGDDIFAWRKGYSVFSVTPGIVSKVVNYIENQEKHHRVFELEKELDLMQVLK